MELEKYNLEGFEEQMREQLNSLHDVPDADLWERIAVEQIKINRAQSLRKFLLPGAGTLLLLIFCWFSPDESANLAVQSSETLPINLIEKTTAGWSDFHLNVVPTAAAAEPVAVEKTENLTADDQPESVSEIEKQAANTASFSSQKIDFQKVRSIEAQLSPDSESSIRGFIQHLEIPKIQPLEIAPKLNLPVPATANDGAQASVLEDNSMENLPEVLSEISATNAADLLAENLNFQFEKTAAAPLLPLPKFEFENEKPAPAKVEIEEEDPLTRPVSRRNLRIGVTHTETFLTTSHSQNGLTRNIGLMLESHLAKNFWLLTGFEWTFGQYGIHLDKLSSAEREDVFYKFKFNPYTFSNANSLDTYFDGFAFPLGVSVYKNLRIKKLDGFARVVARPMLVKSSESVLEAPSISQGSLQVDGYGRWAFRQGWGGVQAGVQYRLFGRLRIEAAAVAERTMGRLGHEKQNYSNLGARLGLKWGG